MPERSRSLACGENSATTEQGPGRREEERFLLAVHARLAWKGHCFGIRLPSRAFLEV
jgi:hypothetical protein